ncbi:MAG: hypothetical protein JSV03_12585 [Planctomycetota bacterium]|nr:MAG: hypothetical protein JSV03_12585 [Planctomycetota bacterium]
MSRIKRFLGVFVCLAVILAVIHIAVVQMFLAKILLPPTLMTGIGAYIVYGSDSSVPILLTVTAIHLFIFLLMNIYLFVRAGRDKVLSPLRIVLPSLVYTVLLAALSIRYWFWPIAHSNTDGTLGGIRAGMNIQGAAHVWIYGLANLVGFVSAGLALYLMMKKIRAPGTWLIYNWALYASLFVLLFPWLGGYP